jgi:large subunit ribosomal protein L20
MAKEFRGNRTQSCYRVAKPRVEKSLEYAYMERRLRKRNMRKLWIQHQEAGGGCDLIG